MTIPSENKRSESISSLFEGSLSPFHTQPIKTSVVSDEEQLLLSKLDVLENRVQSLLTENEILEKKLRDSVEIRADLETNFNALQMEFEIFKNTVRETMTPNERLQKDMERLAEKLIDEAERRSEIEHSKQLVEAELEDLTKNLFEEANRMVAVERETTSLLQAEYDNLKAQNNETLALLSQYKEQCAELKSRLFEATMDSNTIPEYPYSLNRSTEPPSLSRSSTFRLRRTGSFSTLATSSGCLNRSSIHDASFRDSCLSRYSGETTVSNLPTLSFSPKDYRFLEFLEFIEASPSQGTYLASKFAKRAITEEIENTLKFESSKTGFFFNKKLMSAVQQGTLNIYQSKDAIENNFGEPAKFTHSSTSTSIGSWKSTLGLASTSLPKVEPVAPVAPVVCTLCDCALELNSYPYIYTLHSGDTESKLSCGLCRSRLVSTTHFFTLLRHIRAGLVKGTPQKLYLSALQAKLQLFMSRSGAQCDDFGSPRQEYLSKTQVGLSDPIFHLHKKESELATFAQQQTLQF